MKYYFLNLMIICVFALRVQAGVPIWDLEQTPTSEVINGISAPNNFFAIAVGENGSIVHFQNGDNGTLIPSGTTNVLYDVYAVSDQLAVAAGVDIVLIWNGTNWQSIVNNENTNYTGLWITPEKNFLYYQSIGSTFSFICPYEIGAVKQGFCLGHFESMLTMCGKSDDIKMIMGNGDIRHYKNTLAPFNGTDELLHDESSFLNLTGVYVPDNSCLPGSFKPLDIFAINDTDEFYHFDGTQWNNMGVSIPNDQTLTWLNGSGGNNIVATGYKPNGMSGNDGVIWTYEGINWTEATNLPEGTPGLTDVAVNVGLVDKIFFNGFDDLNRSFDIADILGGRVAVGENGSLAKYSYLPPLIADVSVTKSLLTQEPIHPGDNITYQVTIKNNGPSVASSVYLHEVYSNNIVLINDCNNIDFALESSLEATHIIGLIDNLGINESITCNFDFVVTGDIGDEITNVAMYTSINVSDPNNDNNRVEVKGVINPSD